MKLRAYRVHLFLAVWVFLGLAAFTTRDAFLALLEARSFFSFLTCATATCFMAYTAWMLSRHISTLDRRVAISEDYAEADELASLPTDDNYIVLFDTVDEEGVQILLLKATSDKCLYYVYCNDKCRVPSGTKFLRFIKSLRHIDGIDYGAVFADGDNWESHRVCELEY